MLRRNRNSVQTLLQKRNHEFIPPEHGRMAHVVPNRSQTVLNARTMEFVLAVVCVENIRILFHICHSGIEDSIKIPFSYWFRKICHQMIRFAIGTSRRDGTLNTSIRSSSERFSYAVSHFLHPLNVSWQSHSFAFQFITEFIIHRTYIKIPDMIIDMPVTIVSIPYDWQVALSPSMSLNVSFFTDST